LGLAITDTTNLAEEITTYLNTFDKEEYEENRKKLLKDFYSDYELFEEKVLAFCE